MKKSLFLLLLYFSSYCFGQSKQDMENIAIIDSIVYANMEIKDKNSYILYSVSNKIIVIDSCKREVTYLSRKYTKDKIGKTELSKKKINTLFNSKNIKNGINYSNNDYDNSCIGSYVYMSIINNQQKIYQFNLPFMLLCDDNNIKYPLDYGILDFLNSLLNKNNYGNVPQRDIY